MRLRIAEMYGKFPYILTNKNTIMTYTIHLLEERAIEVLKSMKNAAKLISIDEEWAVVEISITDSVDIMQLIHCGIKIGAKPFINHK